MMQRDCTKKLLEMEFAIFSDYETYILEYLLEIKS